MRIKATKSKIVDWLFDRQSFFYNLIGGNLVGGAIGMSINLILRSPENVSFWTVILGGMDMLAAGFLMSKIAWKIDIYWKRVEVKGAIEKDFDKLEQIKMIMKEEISADISTDFVLSIIMVILALFLLGSRPLFEYLIK